MDIQSTFYVIASVTLILVSGFILFLILTVYKIRKIIEGSMRVLNVAARETQHSVEALTRGWTQATFVGMAFRMLRAIINLGKG
jgi:hypothetical protein